MAYQYRIGESREIKARVSATDDPKAPVVASAKVRLIGPSGQKIWERNATVAGNLAKYTLNDLKTKGEYKIQWVLTIGTETIMSDPFPLTVKSATEV